MATIGPISGYDVIQAHRARLRSFAALAEQKSASRQDSAQRVLSQGEATRNTMISSIAQIAAGESQLTAMIIRSRMTAEAKAKAEPTRWYI